MLPSCWNLPAIERDKMGNVSMEAFDSGLEIYYTTDGTEPDVNSILYSESFEHKGKG